MPHIQRAHYVLAVPDLAVSSAWYSRVLDGVAAEVDPGNWVFITAGPVVFMLGHCPDAVPTSELGDHQYFAYLIVDDVDAFHERARAAIPDVGGAILKPPTDEPWGQREMALRTVDGHRLMIATVLRGTSEAWPASNTTV